jgi:deoxyribonuclease-4
MIEFGIAGKPRASKNLEQGMNYLRQIGLDATELPFGRGMRLGDDAIKRIGAAALDNGIALSAHAPYFVNMNSCNPETIKKSKNWILDTMEVARKVDAYLVVVHAGQRHDGDTEQATQAVKDGLLPVLEGMESKGLDIFLGIETMGKHSTWGTLEEIKEVCGISKRFVPVVDFAHVHALHNGLFKKQRDYESYLASYEELDLGFLHCHFTGIEYDEKGEKKHLPVESRDPDFLPLARALKKKDYRVRLICESPLLEEDALQLKEWYDSV